MEGAPFIPEYKNDDLERREKHIPKAETIGSLVVEANPEKDPDYRQQSHEHLGKALVSKEALQDKVEFDFEKDPVLRHQQNGSVASRTAASIGGLLRNTDLELGTKDSSSQTSQSSDHSNSSVSTKQHRSTMDLVMLSVIVFLLLLIVLVIILRA